VDDPEAAAHGITEYQRVKVEEPEFSYTRPDQSNPSRDDIAQTLQFEDKISKFERESKVPSVL